jgi:23S rRNA pseudouridine1911/1915/1917 synthase
MGLGHSRSSAVLSKTKIDYMVQPPAGSSCDEPGPAAEADVADAPWDALPEHREADVTAAQHGQRLDKAVVTMAEEFSRNHLQGLIEQGHVRVDGVVATSASRKVLAGQRIEVELVPTAQSQAFRPEAIALDIVFEDAHLMVVNKPAGMVVHPAAGNWSGTLLNALLAHHRNAASLPRAGIVHRLDKDTSGLMVVGKTLAATTALVRQIALREVHRQYLAIVHGELHPASVRIDAPIGRDPKVRVRMAIVASGKPAQTDVEVVVSGAGLSAVRCTLHTGRTHQIRVHLAARGHALVSDEVYGGKPALGLARQALHATRLRFAHPITGDALVFDAAPPADFAAAWRDVAELAR